MDHSTKILIASSLLAVFTLQACEKSEGKITSKGYAPTAQELAVLDFLLKEEADTFVQGGDSMLFKSHSSTTAVEVAKKYTENQVAADQSYHNKNLLVLGTIESINSGLGNTPYVTLRGKSPFQQPQVHFDNPDLSKISALHKGQKTAFVCIGNGAIVGTPMFKDCVFATDFATKKTEKTKAQALDYFVGKAVQDEATREISFLSLVVARQLAPSSTCFTGGQKCEQEIRAILSNKTNVKEKIQAVSEELKAAGISAPAL